MKRLFFTLVSILITSICFAQDIIVQKDGSTIQAKILKVTQSSVEYKKFDNQNGPTYTISTKDLQCINYENGTKDTFVSPDYNPNIVTNETATQFSNDNELLDIYKNRNKKIKTPEMLYKKGKRMKVAGYVVGGTLIAAGIVSVIIGVSEDKYEYEYLYAGDNLIHHKKYANDGRDKYFYIGSGAMAVGAAVGVPLIIKGSSLQKKSREQISSVSAISHDINFNNGSSLNLGIDVLSNNFAYIKTPGIGVRYNF